MNDIHKILIIRLSSIGDIILTTPLIRAVRNKFPQAEISFIVKKEFYDIIKSNPHIDHIFIFDKKKPGALKGLRQEIRGCEFDWIINIHKNLRSTYLTWGLSAIKTTYSKQIFKRTMLVSAGINLYRNPELVYKRYFEAVERFGITYDNQGTEVVVPAENSARVMSELQRLSIDRSKPILVICPGASFSNKRWLPERFAGVADHLSRKHHATVVLHGGKQDVALCDLIHENMQEPSFNLAGQFNLLESAALLSASALVITNDTGMMHLAQAVKKPVVAIFGPTTRELGYFPLPERSAVVQKMVGCRPCTHNGLNKCPKKHFRCMMEITVDDVIDATESLSSQYSVLSTQY